MKTKLPLLLLLNFFCFHSISQVTLVLKPDANEGKDALIEYRKSTVNNNFGNNVEFSTWSWTVNGDLTITRSLIEFKIPSLPAGAIIVSAKLSLKCNTTSSIPQLHSGRNESAIRRIIGTWDENTVTWNNQPATTTTNQVFISASLSNIQDYNDIEIVNMVNDARASNLNAIGLQLSLMEENSFRSLIFASSDHADSTKWPSLKITYIEPTSMSELSMEKSIGIYPNPITEGFLNVLSNVPLNEFTSYALYSMAGIKCKQGEFLNGHKVYVGDLLNGAYQLMLESSNGAKVVFPIVISTQ